MLLYCIDKIYLVVIRLCEKLEKKEYRIIVHTPLLKRINRYHNYESKITRWKIFLHKTMKNEKKITITVVMNHRQFGNYLRLTLIRIQNFQQFNYF